MLLQQDLNGFTKEEDFRGVLDGSMLKETSGKMIECCKYTFWWTDYMQLI